MILRAFDLGITHFDLANNYGPEPGSAESTFGSVLRLDLAEHRDEMIISTKAGWSMWPGPYGDWGSRKYLLASLDASLKRMGLEYVDIFYHHRPDPATPLEESMGALAQAVQQGKALYAGISAYDPEGTRAAVRILRDLRVPVIVHQPKYSMLVRDVEAGLLDTLRDSASPNDGRSHCFLPEHPGQRELSERLSARAGDFRKGHQSGADRRRDLAGLESSVCLGGA